jgi:hypothetical protein
MVTAVSVGVLLVPHRATATVDGPCTAELSGVSVTQGHDTPGTAVHVDYRDSLSYIGESTTGADVTGIRLGIEVLGIDIRTTGGTTEGSTWRSATVLSQYAWAGIGLYRVTGATATDAGRPCNGVVYVCVDGKSPFLTVAGGTAAGLGAVSLGMVARGVAKRQQRGRGRMAVGFGAAGLLGGTAAAVLLQHSCMLPLDVPTVAGLMGGGTVGAALLGAATGGVREEAVAFGPPPARPREEREQRLVYRFVPPADSCIACRNHAAHRTYRSREATEADRAHPGCHCEIVTQPLQETIFESQFAGRDVYDDRQA